MSNVSTEILSGIHAGNVISDELLGINMRFHHNRIEPDSDFMKVLEQIDTNSIRYAGGTISEEHFDITNPNSTREVNVMHLIHPELIPARTNGEPVVRNVTPLDDYLGLIEELGGEPVIVLPTYRFFDQDTRGLTDNAEQDIRTFVRELFEGRYGPADKVTLEIGNEYYQDFRFNWTLQEFANLQAQIAEWVDDEVTKLGQRDDLTLLAQAAHVRNNNAAASVPDNKVLTDAFAGADTVDGVILHFYGTSAVGDPLAMGRFIGDQLDGTRAAWRDLLGPDFDIAVTEWNVGESGEDTTIVNGTMRTAPLLYMFAEMVAGGVDLAQLWAARTDGPAGLSLRRESGDDLTPTGHFLEMLSDSVNGLRLVDGGASANLTNAQGTHVGYTYTFEGDDRSVTYFASGTDDALALSANLSSQIRDGAFVYARKLDVAAGDELGGYFSDAQVTVDTDIELVTRGGQTFFESELAPYALIELHVVHNGGVVVEGDSENSIADRLTGGDFDDVLAGHDGWDWLRGMDGNDLLDGGNDRDYLRGQAGDDDIYGGNGRDRLLGGRGDDEIYGGNGNDRIMGHNDDDMLFGGVGRDQIFGENDDDQLFGGAGKDLLNGGNGNDLLDGGAGFDTLSGGDGEDQLAGGTGKDILNGGNGNDQLDGGAGFDRLDGGAGDDLLTGGDGKDTFVFVATDAGQDTITDFGTGDRLDVTSYGFATSADALAAATDTQDGVLVELGGGNSVLLAGVELSAVDALDFIV
ncbi:MAG: calcium-binding protein [Pseudomonadota bacterium]